MSERKSKEFRDPVHGYISVPADWCSAFIDTPIFQRLRHIEQTSMRPLYPSARHDRFAHSLGVYHLAKLAFHHLKENTDPAELKGVDLDQYEKSFLVAALMHDCGHACFSHTFENLYNLPKDEKSGNTRSEDFLFSVADENEGFVDDYLNRRGTPAAHEIFSAAIFLEHYRKAYQELVHDDHLILVARMITGCVYTESDTPQKQVENCLIRLVNGRTVDMDKLDYILRDTWASGVDNVSIDIRRLLSALEIVRIPNTGMLDVAFRKSALSVLQSVVDGRNYLYRWIYSHHTVCYYTALLRAAVEALDKVVSKGGKETFLKAISSREAFKKPVTVGQTAVYLPCDDDVFSLLKAQMGRRGKKAAYLRELATEIISRRPSRVPLWKTEAEFEIHFHLIESKNRSTIYGTAKNRLEKVLGEQLATRVLVEDAKSKVIDLMDFDQSKLWVKFQFSGKNDVRSFQEIAANWQEAGPQKKSVSFLQDENVLFPQKKNVSFFYVFIPREAEAKIPECIQALVTATVSF